MTTDDEWKQKLSPEQYRVLREKGTEAPFSGKALDSNGDGDYKCAACGTVLFHSDALYESDMPSLEGWPSFSEVAGSGTVDLVEDNSHGMQRTEVVCKTCGGHLGHLFDDTSSPNGKHYCVNAVALDFEAQK